MRILEMAEQVAREAEAAGGAQFVSLAGLGVEPRGRGSERARGRPGEGEPDPEPAFGCSCSSGTRAAGGPSVDQNPSPLPAGVPRGADPHWRPAPRPDGSLLQDPDFTLITAAGPLPWALFHDSTQAGTDGEYGFGRRASFPLKLAFDGTTVTVMHEDGTERNYLKVAGNFQVVGTPNGDALVQNGDLSWDETRGNNQFRFHFLPGNMTSLSYSATPQGQFLTHNYDASQRLVSVLEPAGRRVTLGYATSPANHVSYVQDWGDRRNTLSYSGANDLSQVMGPTGCITLYGYDGSHRINSVTDPEGFQTTYTYDNQGRVASLSVAGNFSPYTYLYVAGVLNTGFTDPLGHTWTHLTHGGDPVGQIDPLGNRQTYVYQNHRMLSAQNALGFITSHTYNSLGLLTGTQDALGNWVTLTRDAFTNVVAQQNQLGFITTYNYGPSPQMQQVQSVVDPLGFVTSYTYLPSGLPQATIDPLGFITTQVWNSMAQRVAEITALGAITTHLYDLAGNEVGTIDPLGRQWTFGYDNQSRRVSQQNPLGALWTTLYDARGMVQAEVDPLGHRTSFQWNAYGAQTALIDPLGFITTTVYDAYNQAIAGVNALGFITTTTFDAAGRAVAVQDALGFLTTTVFDAAARAVAGIDALGFVTTTVYDPVGRAVAGIDARGFASTTVFDAAGQPTASVDALGNIATTVYNGVGESVAAINRLGFITTSLFDARRLLVAQQDANGFFTTSVYDGARELVAVQSANGARSTGLYDAAGQQSATVSPLGYRTSFFYDAASQPIGTQDALGFLSTTVFDLAGRSQAEVDPLGFRTTTVYDPASRAIAQQDALGRLVTTVYDADSQTIAAQNALGFFSTLVYDPTSRLIAQADANSHRTTSLYNARGDLVASQDALGALTTFQYDGAGNRTLRLDARGRPTTYTFDPLSRVVGQLYADSTRVTWGYDAESQPLLMADVTGPTGYGFDPVGQTLTVSFGTGQRLTYSYDNSIRQRTGLLDSNAGRTTYAYDLQARLLSIVNPQNEHTNLTWDALDREIHRTLANGFAVSHTFDAAGRETFVGYWSGSNVLQASYQGTYDPVANRLSQSEIDGSVVSWSYDAANQLVSEQRSGSSAYNVSYQYDPAGNRLVKSDSGQVSRYNYNAANELLVLTPPSGAATTFTWDGNGNTLVQVTGSARTTYTWDDENRLLGVLFSNGQRETYSYAADGLRRKKVDIGGLQSLYVWDEENLLLWTDQNLGFQNQYTQHPGQWGGLVSERHTGSSFFYGFDLAANTRFMAQISGSITDHYLYRAFGDGEVVSGSNFNPYQYGGQYGYFQEAIPVEGSQRYYVRARHLRVDLGRWVSRDPAGLEKGDSNLYFYAENRPVVRHDPSGRQLFPALPFFEPHVFHLPVPPPPVPPGGGGGGGGRGPNVLPGGKGGGPTFPPGVRVLFCYRPVQKPFGAKIFSHWFLWTKKCGCIGWGREGVMLSCRQNLGRAYAVGDVTCVPEKYTAAQEQCICQLAASVALGGAMCGKTWPGYTYNPFTNKCQDFVNCLLVTCVGPSAWMGPVFGLPSCCKPPGGSRGGSQTTLA